MKDTGRRRRNVTDKHWVRYSHLEIIFDVRKIFHIVMPLNSKVWADREPFLQNTIP